MNRRRIVLVVIPLLVAAAVLPRLMGRIQAQQPQEETTSATLWEYATISEVQGHSTGKADLAASRLALTTNTLYEIYSQLGGKVEEPKFRKVHLLNLLGRQGWELVAVNAGLVENERVAYNFTFKRPLN